MSDAAKSEDRPLRVLIEGSVTLIAGVMFAIGLVVSGMTNPDKVMGFLNFFGRWDPSLMFVMGGAIGVNMPVWFAVRQRNKPLAAKRWSVPPVAALDGKLIVGSVLFGLGWGLSGLCPGPAVVSLIALTVEPWAFVAAMLVGMRLVGLYEWRLAAKIAGAPPALGLE
ncbi:MAG: YeeE/YedE family protein [Deltaproteobacteria bacterium]|nr:YeeE/YedE family protein [Deltaproteobacteria bacterium]